MNFDMIYVWIRSRVHNFGSRDPDPAKSSRSLRIQVQNRIHNTSRFSFQYFINLFILQAGIESTKVPPSVAPGHAARSADSPSIEYTGGRCHSYLYNGTGVSAHTVGCTLR
jgi:hypothetical protein